MPDDGLDRIAQARRHLPRRRRLSRRARPRLAVGPADPDPPRLPAVHQPAARAPVRGPASPARRPQAGRHRLLDRAREQRGRVFLDRRPHVRGHRATRRRSSRRSSRKQRLRPRHALRLRAGHDAQAQARSPRPPSRTASRSRCPTGTSASPRSRKEYPEVKTSQFHIDILTAHLVRNPHWFDVIVGSNLFGDILSDLGPATTGTIAIAPGGNINPEKEFPSMFEPVHGSRARHRRQGHRQPDRPDLVGRHDARAPRPQGGRRRHRQGDRDAARRAPTCAPPTWAARPPARSSARRLPNWSRNDAGARLRRGYAHRTSPLPAPAAYPVHRSS